MKTPKKTRLIFKDKFPHPKIWGPETLLIYDSIFDGVPAIRTWIRKFPQVYAVRSGERLKSVDRFPQHFKKIMKRSEGFSVQQMNIVVLGGGSVGDFAGFMASVFKRGVRLTQIPSTWLSAVDSAHGGKNGLNVAKVKNQVGTFYPAAEVYLIRQILEAQPDARIYEALGEVVKISLIHGAGLWKKIGQAPRISSRFYWQNLPALIAAKLEVVGRDPLETKGIRHILNLGHTMGHVWEAEMQMPHGLAILHGVAFALEWSLAKKIMSSQQYYAIRLSEIGSFLPDRLDLKKILRSTKNAARFLRQDKKMHSASRIRFVFLRGIGDPIIKVVSVEEIITEMKRQAR